MCILEYACRICRHVPCLAYTTVPVIHRQLPRNIPEGCVNGTRPCTERETWRPMRYVELGTHPAASPCGGIVHLSGAVETQPGEWAAAQASWRLTMRPGEGEDRNTRDYVRPNRHPQHTENRLVSSSGRNCYFRQCREAERDHHHLGHDVAVCVCAWIL